MRTTSVPPPVLPLLLTELGIASPPALQSCCCWCLLPCLYLQSETLEAAQFGVEVLANREWGWERERRVVGKIGSPAAWPVPLLPLEENVMKRGVTECSPSQEGLPAQTAHPGLGCSEENKLPALRESREHQAPLQWDLQPFPGKSMAAEPLQSTIRPSGCSGECRICQDLPGSASLFGLCIAGSGSRLINRFQALPSAEASVSVFPLPTPPPSCNSSLTTWAWHRAGQELAGGKTREILHACLSPLVFYLPVQP